MPKTKTSQRNLLRRTIIRLLKHAGAGLFELATIPLTTRCKGVRWLDPKQIRLIVNKLVYEGELVRHGQNHYRLTQLGVVRSLPVIRQTLAKNGQVRILVFDIPESERRRRDCFRRHLKWLGFRPHQRSVWVSKYCCEDWIKDLLDYHGVGEWVSLYIGQPAW
jgi:DNA-binding transcriptional regulator PaaX